jgi:protein-tyrosine phosphatase
MPATVLLVCTGNICRSPMAEHLLRHALGDTPLTFRSAGTIARPGEPMSRHAVTVLADRGIDGSDFRATRLDEHAVAGADIVVGMAHEHRAAAVTLRPALLNRAFTLAELSRICADVDEDEVKHGPLDERFMSLVRLAATRRTNTLPADPMADDLPDPIGLPLPEYEKCATTIDSLLRPVLDVLTAS